MSYWSGGNSRVLQNSTHYCHFLSYPLEVHGKIACSMNKTPWLQVIEKPLSNPPGILPCLLASIMLEEGVMQAAWGGNPDTYTNTLCSAQLRNTAGTGKVKTGGFKGGGAERMLSSGSNGHSTHEHVAVVVTCVRSSQTKSFHRWAK